MERVTATDQIRAGRLETFKMCGLGAVPDDLSPSDLDIAVGPIWRGSFQRASAKTDSTQLEDARIVGNISAMVAFGDALLKGGGDIKGLARLRAKVKPISSGTAAYTCPSCAYII